MSDKPFSWVPKENLLSFEELFGFVRAVIDEGITKIRITGGEPTLREDLDKFFAMICGYKPDIDIAMTTNGFLLSQCVDKLAKGGLKRINISLDSLKPEVAKQIAGGKDVLPQVLEGVDAALATGLTGQAKYHIEEMQKEFDTPAKLYRTNDGYMFGVVELHKEDFCKSCNRFRLIAEGYLISCLYFDETLDIKDTIRAGNIPVAIEIFKQVIKNKPEKNRWSGESVEISNRAFYMIGG